MSVAGRQTARPNRRPEDQRDPEECAIEISEQQIEQADADVLFSTSCSEASPGGEERRERFLANPLWGRLTAVQNGHAYEVRDEI